MDDLCSEVRFAHSHSVRKQLWTLNLVYLNDVTEHDRRYMVELKIELANSATPKSQFQFRSLEKSQFQFHSFFGSIPKWTDPIPAPPHSTVSQLFIIHSKFIPRHSLVFETWNEMAIPIKTFWGEQIRLLNSLPLVSSCGFCLLWLYWSVLQLENLGKGDNETNS